MSVNKLDTEYVATTESNVVIIFSDTGLVCVGERWNGLYGILSQSFCKKRKFGLYNR